MHTWMWGENYPDLMDALMPIACLPVAVAGRNHVFRQMITDAIRQDPDWKHGDYTGEPRDALRAVRSIELIAGSSPLDLQRKFPTSDAAEKGLDEFDSSNMGGPMRTISCFNGAHRRIMIHPRCSVRSPLQ
jgi:homoserine O-acetyltransferase